MTPGQSAGTTRHGNGYGAITAVLWVLPGLLLRRAEDDYNRSSDRNREVRQARIVADDQTEPSQERGDHSQSGLARDVQRWGAHL